MKFGRRFQFKIYMRKNKLIGANEMNISGQKNRNRWEKKNVTSIPYGTFVIFTPHADVIFQSSNAN